MHKQRLTIALIWLAVAICFVIFFRDLILAVVFLAIAGYFFYRATTTKAKPGGACCA